MAFASSLFCWRALLRWVVIVGTHHEMQHGIYSFHGQRQAGTSIRDNLVYLRIKCSFADSPLIVCIQKSCV
jgi:hypothetical protein